MQVTTTLFKYIQSELIKQGLNEFTNDEGRLVFFNEDSQFITKIMKYDEDVAKIIDDLFLNLSLDHAEFDFHFKKTFTLRFLNRQINRQTIEAFKVQLMSTFLTQEFFINQVYNDYEKFITGTGETIQENKQDNAGTTTTDSRQAYAELPQNKVNLDVDDSVMASANDNTISKNKQTNKQQSEGTTISKNNSYLLDQLIQSSQLMEHVFLTFDEKCFLQIW